MLKKKGHSASTPAVGPAVPAAGTAAAAGGGPRHKPLQPSASAAAVVAATAAAATTTAAAADSDQKTSEPSGVSVEDLNKYIRFHPRAEVTAADVVEDMVASFVASNADPATSPNLQQDGTDDMSQVAFLLCHAVNTSNPTLGLLLLQMLKILLRKEQNRASVTDHVVRAVVAALASPPNVKCAAEAANVVLNMCYEESNVEKVIERGGLRPIVGFLSAADGTLQASACGALQSICFQVHGREVVIEEGGLPPLIALLTSTDESVIVRAVGALHNISSDQSSISIIREANGIPPLVELLHVPSAAVCASAAGAIQNLSREPAARIAIRNQGAVEPLIDLLLGNDTQSQICAAGALLNIVGPEIGPEDPNDPARIAFRKLLADSIALGAVVQCLAD